MVKSVHQPGISGRLVMTLPNLLLLGPIINHDRYIAVEWTALHYSPTFNKLCNKVLSPQIILAFSLFACTCKIAFPCGPFVPTYHPQKNLVIRLTLFSVNKGRTVVHRKSSESSVTIPDRETTKQLVKRVHDALEGRFTYFMNKDVRHCGYPDRLLLPKGKKEGMPFSLYVIVTNYDKEKVQNLKSAAIVNRGDSACAVWNLFLQTSPRAGY